MRSMSRRDLLKKAAIAASTFAGGSAIAACGGATKATNVTSHRSPPTTTSRPYQWVTPVAHRQPDSLPFPDIAAGTDTLPEIDHIIVLMMENHSFDNYLGMLGRGDGFTLDSAGKPTNWNPTATGRRLLAFPMPTDCQFDKKPSQEWTASHEQYDGGTNLGFVTSPSGPVAMGYWSERSLPFTYSLASTFTLSDRWFCCLLGQTDPNRRFLTAATSAGMVDDIDSQAIAKPPNGTIFDRLDQYGISWRDYYHTSSLPTLDVWFTDPASRSKNVVSVDEFFDDVTTGSLPGFCIIDPDFDHGSEENPQDIAVGQVFASEVVNAVMSGPAWEKTLLVWTYDEHGGYYDHVPPPPALAPDSIAPLAPVGPNGESAYDGFNRYGFRVPAAVICPYSRKGHVTHTIHDHTSILAMVERKWNLPAMTLRDANAADLSDFLDLSNPAFLEPPTLAKPANVDQACSPGNPGGPIPPPGYTVSAPK